MEKGVPGNSIDKKKGRRKKEKNSRTYALKDRILLLLWVWTHASVKSFDAARHAVIIFNKKPREYFAIIEEERMELLANRIHSVLYGLNCCYTGWQGSHLTNSFAFGGTHTIRLQEDKSRREKGGLFIFPLFSPLFAFWMQFYSYFANACRFSTDEWQWKTYRINGTKRCLCTHSRSKLTRYLPKVLRSKFRLHPYLLGFAHFSNEFYWKTRPETHFFSFAPKPKNSIKFKFNLGNMFNLRNRTHAPHLLASNPHVAYHQPLRPWAINVNPTMAPLASTRSIELKMKKKKKRNELLERQL